MPRILLIPGSLRSGATTTAVLRTAHAVAPAGVETTLYDGLGRLPHFNPDDDPADGSPPGPVAELRARLAEALAALGAAARSG